MNDTSGFQNTESMGAGKPLGMPQLERFIAVASGKDKWNAREAELRKTSEEFVVHEAGAHALLASLQETEEESRERLLSAAECLRELRRPEVQEAATRYIRKLLPDDDWEQRFVEVERSLDHTDTYKIRRQRRQTSRLQWQQRNAWPLAAAVCVMAAVAASLLMHDPDSAIDIAALASQPTQIDAQLLPPRNAMGGGRLKDVQSGVEYTFVAATVTDTSHLSLLQVDAAGAVWIGGAEHQKGRLTLRTNVEFRSPGAYVLLVVLTTDDDLSFLRERTVLSQDDVKTLQQVAGEGAGWEVRANEIVLRGLVRQGVRKIRDCSVSRYWHLEE